MLHVIMLLLRLLHLWRCSAICDATLHCTPCSRLGLLLHVLACRGSQTTGNSELASLPDMPAGPSPWFIVYSACSFCIASIPVSCIFVALTCILWSASLIASGMPESQRRRHAATPWRPLLLPLAMSRWCTLSTCP